jgi:elongation factor 1 alpha-like protein
LVASGKGGKGPPKTNAEKKADQIANGIEAMKVDETPRARSKNLDVLKEWEKVENKNEANFVVIGVPTSPNPVLLPANII